MASTFAASRCGAHASSSGSSAVLPPPRTALLHGRRQPLLRQAAAPLGTRRAVVAAGILDSYRQQQQGPATNGGVSHSVSSAEESDAPAVELLVAEEGITFTEADTPCTTDCVIQVYTEEELEAVFKSVLPDTLVVVDWFKTDCPACKYMAPGFHRMCRNASEHAQHIVFVKHNIYDADEELTSLARQYKVKSVPLFTFHNNNGELVESFATRDKARLTGAVDRLAPVTVERWDEWEADIA